MSEEYFTAIEQRAYAAAYERAQQDAQRPHPAPLQATVTVAEREKPLVTVLEARGAGGRNREYEQWRRTPGGRFHSMAYPDPQAAYEEHERETGPEAVRAAQDRHEVTYGRRPPAAAVQAMLNARHWDRGQGFDGTAQGLQDQTRWAFGAEGWVVLNRGEDPPDIPVSPALARRA